MSQIKISGLNQKTAMRFFEKLNHFSSYLLGISSKMGGKWGNMIFFEARFLQKFCQFCHEKISNSGNSFSCDQVLSYTILKHIRKNFYSWNLCHQRWFCISGQKTYILLYCVCRIKYSSKFWKTSKFLTLHCPYSNVFF